MPILDFMNQQGIIMTVAKYLVSNSHNLKGMLRGEHYFNIGGASLESSCKPYTTAHGHAVDILAESMDKGDFFGEYIPSKPEQADNRSNAKLIPLKRTKEGIEILVKEFVETDKGLLVIIPRTEARPYLAVLKDVNEFRKYSNLVDLSSSFGKVITGNKILTAIDDLFAKDFY